MNVNNLTRAQLADFAKNAATQVAAGKVTGLSPEQALSISETLMAEAEILAERDREQVAQRAASIEATQKARDQDARVSRLLQSLKYGRRASAARLTSSMLWGSIRRSGRGRSSHRKPRPISP